MVTCDMEESQYHIVHVLYFIDTLFAVCYVTISCSALVASCDFSNIESQCGDSCLLVLVLWLLQCLVLQAARGAKMQWRGCNKRRQLNGLTFYTWWLVLNAMIVSHGKKDAFELVLNEELWYAWDESDIPIRRRKLHFRYLSNWKMQISAPFA